MHVVILLWCGVVAAVVYDAGVAANGVDAVGSMTNRGVGVGVRVTVDGVAFVVVVVVYADVDAYDDIGIDGGVVSVGYVVGVGVVVAAIHVWCCVGVVDGAHIGWCCWCW